LEKGIIFDIKEFAVFDGPSIRQTVFFKGCPLRCNWCHNPEGLHIQPELMVSVASCSHCGKCEEICIEEECTLCGRCIPVCPLNLRRIVGEVITSEDLVARIRRDSAYYETYGGGVTFSGGEPLMQPTFLLEVISKIPEIHKALETSGYSNEEIFKEVINDMDFVMMDIKIFDEELHKNHTGVSNEKILRNASNLCKGDVPFIVRIPLIPGVNDNEKNFRNIAKLIKGARMLQKVELLPYHKTAGAKYSMIGETYSPIFNPENDIHIPKNIFDEYGIRSEVL